MKNFSSTLTAMLVLAAPLATVAQNAQLTTHSLQPNEHALNLPGTTTIEAPPAGFDPIAASDEELAYHGFPPRPNETIEPEAYKSWAKAMKASKIRVVPTLEPTNLFHGPGKITRNTSPSGQESNGPLTSHSWSGYVEFTGTNSYGPASYYYLYAVVPVARQAFGVCNGGWDNASSWVGMDGATGAGVSELLQAGAEFDAYCSAGLTTTFYSLWFEWYPYSETRVTSIPIVPGDDLFVEVWHTTTTQGYAYFVNENTNQALVVGFTAYPGYSLVGNSAEWILEGPPTFTPVTRLTNYIADPFWSAFAVNESGVVTTPSSPASNPITMLDFSSNPISYPTLLGPTSFLMQDEGTAKF
jgi:Peptidase A4 family